MTMRRGIAAAGNWIIDHVKIVDKLPAEEHLATISAQTDGTGGAPYNVLVGLRSLSPDIPLSAIGVVGRDRDGDSIMDHLHRLNIDTTLMRLSEDSPTSYTDVMTVAVTGRRTFFHHLGANAELSPDDFRLEAIPSAILHLGYLTLLPNLDAMPPGEPAMTYAAKVFATARAAGITTSLDVVTDLSPRLTEILRATLPETDYFIANELETGCVAGISARNDAGQIQPLQLEVIADAILALGVRNSVVIHAPECGFWKSRNGEAHLQPSLQVPADFIQGTAGAGDAFCAGILYGIHESWSAEKSLLIAVANAAQSLNDPTTTGGLKSLHETLSLIEAFGFRDI
ncbi:MAG: carbohydrate kinase family protein [Candidatus Sumerlaeaceae bacterium]|nr:carbohydrate kinase family protein [Candidatus Sumerlaeaceae bacterium]